MATPTPENPVTVLIVDDQPFFITMLQNILQARGYRVVTAVNGVEGLAQARKHRPDAILLDVQMPEMDGFTMCERVKQDFALRHIPVIILTATTDAKLNERAFKAGAEVTALKTVAGDRLINILRIALSKDKPAE